MRIKFILIGVFLLAISLFLFIPQHSGAEGSRSISYHALAKKAEQSKPGIPIRMTIPSIKAASSIESLNIEDGKMETPEYAEEVGWYTDSVRPGEDGNAVFAGHRDDREGNPGIFWRLGQIQVDDSIYVEDDLGRKREFRVVDVREYLHTNVPLTTLFTKSLSPHLILITCSGEYNSVNNNYSERLIVTAVEIE